MSVFAFVALSLTPALPVAAPASALPSVAGYGCIVHDNGRKSACPASPLRVAQGKGMIAPRAPRTRQADAEQTGGPAPVCHSDPMKGRACRHHQIQTAEANTSAPALAAR